MALIQQLVMQKLERYNENLLNKMNGRAIWNFYMCYSLASAALGREPPKSKIIKINKLWKKFVLQDNPSAKLITKIKNCMDEDMKLINEYISKSLQEMDTREALGSIWKPNTIGVRSFEW